MSVDLDKWHPTYVYLVFWSQDKIKREGLEGIHYMQHACDWAERNVEDVTDKHGRKPLLALQTGRVAETTIQRYIYTATRPCYDNSGNCPFDREPEACEAMSWNASRVPAQSARMPFVGAMSGRRGMQVSPGT
ncbi:hypothetical protein [Salinilacihabitans rarus]|uniref:hypothetical protein n=1 Tax=Salinilacihabitans rarus TaxID=2961596 RepID=UPI0020C8C171|nr:hypothetical protein [Salinilacihabitans rarus]